jgi:hypothetical protein
VCNIHGGLAPQVQRKAAERLRDAADTAAARLVELVGSPDEQIAVRAVQLLLDRTGHGPTGTQVNVDGGKVRYEIPGVDLEAL